MGTSAKQHIIFQFLKLTLLMVVTFVLMTHLIFYDIENNMLVYELKKETAHYGARVNNIATTWKTASTITTFVPEKNSSDFVMPIQFRGLSAPFSGEVSVAGKDYWVLIQSLKTGTLYIAKDISLFEEREALFSSWMILIGFVFILIGGLFAWISAKRIFNPLNKLAEEIAALNPQEHGLRVTTGQRDEELNSIATTFNLYLESMEKYIQREKALVSMASHELRTPVAIISGALDVLDGRNTLSPQDRKTVSRLRSANLEMHQNIEAILAVARNKEQSLPHETFRLGDILALVADELGEQHPEYAERISVLPFESGHIIEGSMALVKILIRNLLQNALLHTRGAVELRQHDKGFSVSDAGCGLSETTIRRLEASEDLSQDADVAGLGLFIVTLVCERLGWKIYINNQADGMAISVHVVT